MVLVLLSAYFNHHQKPLCDELFGLLGNENFWFVATQEISEARIRLGYQCYSGTPYLLESYKSDAVLQKIKKICMIADVVVIGSAPEKFVERRILENKLTFRYNERWFKNRPWYLTGIKGWINIVNNHLRYKHKPLYMLAASAFTANDVYNVGAYKNKVFKWGYFTAVNDEIGVSSSLPRSSVLGTTLLLWCARFLKWKHPELPIQLAKRLKDKGYVFHLDMIGIGEELESTQLLAKELDVCDVVSFLGSMPNKDVLAKMRNHDIFLFTSDKHEGWGAVLNEAMSCGSAVVASDRIGATPFLIDDGNNGMVFQSENLDSLYGKTKYLLDYPEKRQIISNKAMQTMRTLWCPKTAALRLVALSSALLQGKSSPYSEGPCSPALPIKVK